jgi:hypothetical protein
MGWYWTCANDHASGWGDDERPDEEGGCPRCGSLESQEQHRARDHADSIPAAVYAALSPAGRADAHRIAHGHGEGQA